MALFSFFNERKIINEYQNITLERFKDKRFKVVDGKKEIEAEIKIHIGGAVRNPGFYKIIPGIKLKRIIKEVVILRDDADISSLNLDKKIYNDDKIIVPHK
ncbi:MAG: hypothetical protein R6V14_09280 [Halanaerobiales bacterium]